jgi:hypothetical protein
VRIFCPFVQPAASFLAFGVTDHLHCSTIGTQFIRHNHLRLPVSGHCFPEEFQRRFAIPPPRDVGFQHLSFVSDCPPEVVPTANPALGAASDLLVGLGGSVILSETPEIYGAEQLLLRRAINGDVADKIIACIAWWEDYTCMNGGSLDNNPSPSNKAGGLTTILENPLGAVAKAGMTPLTAFYDYAEATAEPGFIFMDTPGYDPVSATGQIAGAHRS